ncbi:MAG: tRNA-queuosine alpha-mannosyltransferase domain-containing protein [Neptuniibacter sp.]
MKILLLSAYDAESHRYWWEGLKSELSEHEWTVLTLPARYFSWRIRSNALTWSLSQQDVFKKHYDLIIATSMTDLSTLRGLSPELSQIPTLVSFHENQFGYPGSGNEFKSVEPQILNFYTALAADHVVFNSRYNFNTFFQGLSALLDKMPDLVPPDVIKILKQKAEILPVPLSRNAYERGSKSAQHLDIVWNHRWEYDKNPALLLNAMGKLNQTGVNFKLHVVGRQFRKIPEEFLQLKETLGDKIGHWGYIESRALYQRILKESDVVLSTAIHDFQGIAVLEGVAAGSIPVVPDRLAYKELFAPEYRYSSTVDEAENLADHLTEIMNLKKQGRLDCPDVSNLSWACLADEYRRVIKAVRTR